MRPRGVPRARRRAVVGLGSGRRRPRGRPSAARRRPVRGPRDRRCRPEGVRPSPEGHRRGDNHGGARAPTLGGHLLLDVRQARLAARPDRHLSRSGRDGGPSRQGRGGGDPRNDALRDRNEHRWFGGGDPRAAGGNPAGLRRRVGRRPRRHGGGILQPPRARRVRRRRRRRSRRSTGGRAREGRGTRGGESRERGCRGCRGCRRREGCAGFQGFQVRRSRRRRYNAVDTRGGSGRLALAAGEGVGVFAPATDARGSRPAVPRRAEKRGSGGERPRRGISGARRRVEAGLRGGCVARVGVASRVDCDKLCRTNRRISRTN